MQAEDELLRLGLVKDGDMMVMTIGEAIGKAGHTNTMKIVRVGDHRKHKLKRLKPHRICLTLTLTVY